jgi:hypothetical protein
VIDPATLAITVGGLGLAGSFVRRALRLVWEHQIFPQLKARIGLKGDNEEMQSLAIENISADDAAKLIEQLTQDLEDIKKLTDDDHSSRPPAKTNPLAR